jgi:hypothetical protein
VADIRLNFVQDLWQQGVQVHRPDREVHGVGDFKFPFDDGICMFKGRCENTWN